MYKKSPLIPVKGPKDFGGTTLINSPKTAHFLSLFFNAKVAVCLLTDSSGVGSTHSAQKSSTSDFLSVDCHLCTIPFIAFFILLLIGFYRKLPDLSRG